MLNRFIAVFLTSTLLISYDQPKVKLSGEWVATIYSQQFIGQRHGAFWNGFQCSKVDGSKMPDVVTNIDLGLAMSGPEFYCLPIVVCYKQKCVKAIATDVPRDNRLRGPNKKFYNHIDLYPRLAKELGIKGIQWGKIRVYIEAK